MGKFKFKEISDGSQAIALLTLRQSKEDCEIVINGREVDAKRYSIGKDALRMLATAWKKEGNTFENHDVVMLVKHKERK